MKKWLLLLLPVIPAIVSAQAREKHSTQTELRHAKIKEVYEVLKTDTSVRDGGYRYYRKNKLLLEGYYKNGSKDSVWKAYQDGNVLLAIKWYSLGKRTGQWEFFNQNGDPEWSYDFTKETPSYAKPPVQADTATFYYLDETGAMIRGSLDKHPIALNAKSEWSGFLMHNLIYPQAAMDNEEQGLVLVGITVDEKGDVKNYSILKSASQSLDEEAMNMATGFHFEFIPAEKNGKKVTAVYPVPVSFKIETGR